FTFSRDLESGSLFVFVQAYQSLFDEQLCCCEYGVITLSSNCQESK
ncbi:unnamed protein product, partial [Linum tenue]